MGIGTFVSHNTRPAGKTSTPRDRTSTGDLILIAAVIALGILGLLMLYSASTDFSMRNYKSPTYMFNKQIAVDCHWGGRAFVLLPDRLSQVAETGPAADGLDGRDAGSGAVYPGRAATAPCGRCFGGSVQPSELAKLVTILYLSVWLYSKREFLHDIQLGLFPLAFILGSIGGLIYLQPDLSAAMTIFILGGLLFFLAGGDLRQIILFCVVALVAGWLVVQFSSTGRARLASYLAGLKDPLKSSDHVLWSLESVYRGKWFGVGIGNATTKLIGLPFAATDSIFAVLVEELGLFGAFALIGLYGIVLWRGLKIASKAPDLLGSVMAAGLTFWIVIEAVINMSMMVGLFPLAGNALPFISAGGSNLISSLAAIGILLSISRQSGKKAPVESEERRTYSATVDLRRRDRRRSVSRTRRPASH